MSPSKEQLRLLHGKLRLPVHINYIAKYILKVPLNETKEILYDLIEDGIIEESRHAKEYYVLKSQK